MKTALFFLFVLMGASAFSQAGELDAGFATDGIFTSQIDTTSDEAKAVAIQVDGKIITAGYHGINSFDEPEAENWYLRRFNADGSPDLSFGNDGVVLQDLAGGTDAAWDIEVLSDGKLIVAGFGWQSWERALVMQFNADGSLDTSFSGDGMAVIEIGGFTDRIWDIEIQPDGKIVGCGTCFVSSSNNDWCAVRLNADGSLDSSFGTGGMLTLDLGEFQVAANDLEILDDGRILMAGYGVPEGTYLMQFVMLDSNGQLDETWDEDGLVEVTLNGYDDAITSIAMQDDGKIVAGGYTLNGSEYDFALIRLNPDGSLDESFGDMGYVQTPFGTLNDYIESIFIRPDGKIVAGGNAVIDGSSIDFALAMYHPDGSLVENFGNGGKVTTAVSSVEDMLFAIHPDANGDIVAVGSTLGGAGGSSIYEQVVVKYLGELTVGLVDGSQHAEFLVYPNPIAQSARLKFRLNHAGTYSIDLYDLTGAHVMQLLPKDAYEVGENEVELSLPVDLRSGNYVLKVESEHRSAAVTILKE